MPGLAGFPTSAHFIERDMPDENEHLWHRHVTTLCHRIHAQRRFAPTLWSKRGKILYDPQVRPRWAKPRRPPASMERAPPGGLAVNERVPQFAHGQLFGADENVRVWRTEAGHDLRHAPTGRPPAGSLKVCGFYGCAVGRAPSIYIRNDGPVKTAASYRAAAVFALLSYRRSPHQNARGSRKH